MASEAKDQNTDDKSANQNQTTNFGARLGEAFDKLSLWHGRVALFDKVGRLPVSRAFLLAAIICGLLAAIANFQIRQSQYDIWKENKSFTYLDDTPLFSTTDASYFVGLAQEYKRSGDARIYTQKRLYPFYDEALKDEAPQTGMRDFPLLSVLIASLSPDSSTQSLLVTGNGLLPVLGFVLALGILLAFGASGFWLEGAVAAIGAGLAPTFLMRTSIGRIDTDILNLGFFYAVFGLTIFAGRAASLRAAIIWAVLAGLGLNLFFWWYDKAFMGWAFTVGLVWLSYITSRDWRRPVILGLIFIFVSGLALKGIGFANSSSYFQEGAVAGALRYPNTFNTITELQVVPFDQILTSISGSVALGLFGVVGMAVFAFRHPVLAVVYGPASVFALANFLVGNRAVFYSAPMVWFGTAFLAVLIGRFLRYYLPQKLTKQRFGELAVAMAITLGLMGSVYRDDETSSYVPNPSFPVEIMGGFAAMRDNLPQGSVIASWWDYGYASILFNGYNTLHDGGIQTTPVTHYVARALLAEAQSESHAIFHLLASGGLTRLQENSESYEQLEALIAAPPEEPKKPVFLVLTSQMAGWMGSISKLGMWDTKTGKPIEAKNSPYGPTLFYSELRCRQGAVAHQAICNNQLIDFNLGTIDNRPVVKLLTQAKDGRIDGATAHHETGLSHLHLSEETGKGTRVLAFHDRLGNSTFHNLFHLARADENYFDLIYDDYPNMRIYRVK